MTKAPTGPELLASRWPALAKYCPNIHTISAPQSLFLLLDCQEAFYGGAAGGGKSDALLMAALQYADIPGYSALILRRTYAELEKSTDGLIARADSWLSGTDAKRSDGGRKWTFPSGAQLEFGHCENESDKFKFQSAAYQFVGFDELTSFTDTIYEYIGFSRKRKKKFGQIAKVPTRIRSASNPGNIGHAWVKERFVTENTRKPGAVFIPAKVQDNPGLDTDDYSESLAHLNDALRMQLLNGDWDAFQGMAYPDLAPIHWLDDFRLEDAYERYEAADYGLNGAPWALVATDYDGNLIFVDMVYVKEMLPSQLAPLILNRRSADWGEPWQTVMDPTVWKRTGAWNKWGAPAMLSDEFIDNGIPISPANNDPRAGMMRLRELMRPDPTHRFPRGHARAGELGSPWVFFTRSCERLVEELRSAPLQPIEKRDGGEMVDPEWESRAGHAAAMARYAVMAKAPASQEPERMETDMRKYVTANALAARDRPKPRYLEGY